MRKVCYGAAFALLIVSLFSLNFFNSVQQAAKPETAEKLAGFQFVNNDFGFTWTKNSLLRTSDDGNSWREITPTKNAAQTISAAFFSNERRGAAILTDAENPSLELAQTVDGGENWAKHKIDLPTEIIGEADLSRVALEFADEQNTSLVLRLPSSSNFTRAAVFSTVDGGNSWRLERKFMESGEFSLESLVGTNESAKRKATAKINGKEIQFASRTIDRVSFSAPLAADETAIKVDFASPQNGWILTEAGRCRSFKSDCEQQTRLLVTTDAGENWRDATPKIAQKPIKIADSNSDQFAPGGAIRVSQNRGFDKCAAGTLIEMQAWWNNSPFFDSNVYIGGANHNRSCSATQSAYLNQDWINQVSTLGWGLIPTWVGPQAPCSGSTTSSKHSSDPATAEVEGRAQADLATAAANNLGFAQGTVIYFDMERYDDVSGTGACSTPVKAFLKGWTDRMKERGYVSGVYGSPTNAMGDWINIPAASRMDAVWLARYDNVPSVWQYNSPSPVVPVQYWGNHQRIKQWQGGHNETWGGVTLNIDSNISDGLVAGARAAKNKPADFDGDGKTDVSVYRDGNWFVQNSSNNAFGGLNFGVASDIIAPGDYDGDGRTDYAVFRPSEGTWYAYSYNPARPNAAVLRARQFGTNGDVPVAADYDGDGITDLAVFRRGVWYITPSFDPRDPNFRAEQFGTDGDVPVPGDYDADGRADLAVFRPSNGTWYVQRSTAGFYAVNFGLATDKPVQGDYDGDGKTDAAVYRPSNGTWYALGTTSGFKAFNWGTATDKPAPGDFDGDGIWDWAVFRPENGFWYAMQSQKGFMAVNFGTMGDKPVSGGYVPQN